jgi:RNA 2',3'-cyclic 3'-phosphodiesterase
MPTSCGTRDWRSTHFSDVSGLRSIEPHALHVTLCFLGGRPVDDIDRIAAVCETVGSSPAVELSLGAPVWLPARRPRAIGIELVDRQHLLSDLQGAISDALRGGGWYEPETRPFLAHITLARLRKGTHLRRAELPPPSPLRLTCSAMTLYRSHLESDGARYEALRTIQLPAGG